MKAAIGELDFGFHAARRDKRPVIDTIAQVREVVALGELDPEAIVTPGIFVKKVVAVGAADTRRTGT